ncbi:dNTP triphosphohydrolase [bacterium]|nr:dNTP triphosphohydrolase [bacterium]
MSSLVECVAPERMRPALSCEADRFKSSREERDVILNSRAFQLLQRKTQLFPARMQYNCRTRQSHSLDVAHIGRAISREYLSRHKGDADESLARTFIDTVENACLLHDIGHPPFGHSGESALRIWLSSHHSNYSVMRFDGNPQGFRMMTSQYSEFGRHLNISACLLIATVKYPQTQSYCDMPWHQKIGIFDGDLGIYNDACVRAGWSAGKIHPIALIMDASDDIAYSLSDIEVCMSVGVHQPEIAALLELAHVVDPLIHDMYTFRRRVIDGVVQEVSNSLISDEQQILNGEREKLIDENLPYGQLIARCKAVIGNHECVKSMDKIASDALLGLLRSVFSVTALRNNKYKRRRSTEVDWQQCVLTKDSGGNGDIDESTLHRLVDIVCAMTDDMVFSMAGDDAYQAPRAIKHIATTFSTAHCEP